MNESIQVAEIEVLPYFLEVLSEHQHSHKFTQVFICLWSRAFSGLKTITMGLCISG